MGRRIDLAAVKAMVADAGGTEVRAWRVSGGRIRISYVCRCGRQSETNYQHFRRGKRCRACFHRRLSGPGHPNFNPGLTAEDRRNRRLIPENVAWRRRVFERDLYACMKCGAHGTGVYLVAHHLRNYAEHPAFRFVDSNGVTLCRPCHLAFHEMKGTTGNTPRQFRAWLQETRS